MTTKHLFNELQHMLSAEWKWRKVRRQAKGMKEMKEREEEPAAGDEASSHPVFRVFLPALDVLDPGCMADRQAVIVDSRSAGSGKPTELSAAPLGGTAVSGRRDSAACWTRSPPSKKPKNQTLLSPRDTGDVFDEVGFCINVRKLHVLIASWTGSSGRHTDRGALSAGLHRWVAPLAPAGPG
ncbi:hypothetical protein Q8A73_011223 [Channa argus]|nr:hypothetical protein Q8A73_011223 [Channa argus]